MEQRPLFYIALTIPKGRPVTHALRVSLQQSCRIKDIISTNKMVEFAFFKSINVNNRKKGDGIIYP
ncbi:hypothetical protein DWX41_17175 [Hungatella hathewayi]|uniref:Uncharacterized protein n=1 Tax=Hungatella hathewayi TaxID=154046 RepID=A0A3E2WMA7_9FIRM|nr:hypothetical protein [Faecalicatena contorta]RGC27774.1 hypothetical protein DWX41_17175 [Hungatella hathewayi]